MEGNPGWREWIRQAEWGCIVLGGNKLRITLKMKIVFLTASFLFAATSCTKKPAAGSAALPDNVMSDKPIVLKEGQAVILMKTGDKDLMIGVGVVDGKLSVQEVDPEGRNFGVTWKDSETWETSTMMAEGETHTVVMDKNMDGYADLKAETTPSGTRRFESKGQEWVELGKP